MDCQAGIQPPATKLRKRTTIAGELVDFHYGRVARQGLGDLVWEEDESASSGMGLGRVGSDIIMDM